MPRERHVNKQVAGLGALMIVLGATVFAGTSFKRRSTYLVEVPYTEEVNYTAVVEGWEMQPFEVHVPYAVNVTAFEATPVYVNSSVLDYNGLHTIVVSLSEGPVRIEWSSAKNLEYFAVVGSDRWSLIWEKFELNFGVTMLVVLASGGVLFPLAIYYFDKMMVNCTETHSAPEDYYVLHSMAGSANRTLSGGTYTVAAYNTQSSETANVCNVTISSLRASTEQRLLNHTEVRYMNVTVYRNETRVRLEERVRVEERTRE
jgi:hypothetical protein